MSEPWTYLGPTPPTGGAVTFIEGSSFCRSDQGGDLSPESAQGLFFLDTRFLSELELQVDHTCPEPLSVAVATPFSGTFLGRVIMNGGEGESDIVVFRLRHVGRGMREEVTIRNYGVDDRRLDVALRLGSDFAGLFDVKEERHRARTSHLEWVSDRLVHIRVDKDGHDGDSDGLERHAAVTFSEPAAPGERGPSWRPLVPGRGEWTVCFDVVGFLGGQEVEPRYRCGRPVEASEPVQRLATWRQQVPTVSSDPDLLGEVVSRSVEDLGALRMFDPDAPDRTLIAAGAPWFMTLFGRDSILASWMALAVDPQLAHGVLQTLAHFQGRDVDRETEEEPGRILHEVRFGTDPRPSLASAHIYYGTIDATPLFVVLWGELCRWGLAPDVVAAILPHVERALTWIEEFGDRDGDGYVEYERSSPRGLANQGWKDSWDAIRFADGRHAAAPIALCEVQGYVYAAYRARAEYAWTMGDDSTARSYEDRAADLKARFNRDFWIPDRGWYALALDRDKQPVDALTSNMGHCLWSGIVADDKAATVAEHLLADDLFSGWGIRTHARSMAAYNPVSYHNGSVWPHDNAIAVAGLARYGFREEAHRVMEGLLQVAAHHDGRLPELISGLSREEHAVPAPYPTSCIPQAWAAATPLLLLRIMLGLDVDVPAGRVALDPHLPRTVERVVAEGLNLGPGRLDVRVDEDGINWRATEALQPLLSGPPD